MMKDQLKRETVRPVRPVAPYIGGKRALAKRLVDRIDSQPHAIYAEPFVGMGGIFFRRRQRPKKEVINDISCDVVNLFRLLQRHYQQLLDVLKWQICSRAEFERLCGVDPERLTVEIVESSLVADRKAAAERLMALKSSGIRIAIDDFGTGYSSLAYLTSLPLDCVKIDRGLITDIVGGDRDRIVVRAMIHLAHELGLDVVVEGVESAAQLELLASWGTDLYQGFLGSEALDEVELARFVSATSIAA